MSNEWSPHLGLRVPLRLLLLHARVELAQLHQLLRRLQERGAGKRGRGPSRELYMLPTREY